MGELRERALRAGEGEGRRSPEARALSAADLLPARGEKPSPCPTSKRPDEALTATSLSLRTFRASATPGQMALAPPSPLFLALFLVVPVATVIYVAFTEKGAGAFTLVNFADFFRTDLFLRSFWNSIYVSAMAVAWASALALPLAYITTRFEFRGRAADPDARLPAADHAAVRRRGGDAAAVRPQRHVQPAARRLVRLQDPVHGGAQRRHLRRSRSTTFPFILINLSAALRNIDRAMEEAAQNLGASGFRLFRRIVFPLALPGYVAGAALVFVKVFDDLATPLLLNVKDMLAPQAYLRVTSIGIADPMGYVISVVLIVASVRGLAVRAVAERDGLRDRAARRRRADAAQAEAPGSVAAYAVVTLILCCWCSRRMSGCCCCRSRRCGRSARCRTATRLAHYARVFGESSRLHQEHAALCLARRPDRRRARHRHRLPGAAHPAASAATGSTGRRRRRSRFPASCSASAICAPSTASSCRTARRWPRSGSSSCWRSRSAACPMRCAPATRRLQQISVSLEEAAENLGATKAPHRAPHRAAADDGRHRWPASSPASPPPPSNCRRR